MSSEVSSSGPSVPLADFQKLCREEPNKVYVPKEVQDSARTDFKLNTKADLMAFVGAGLENAKYLNTEPWENNPFKESHPSLVDSFSFKSGSKDGYLAYCPNHKLNNWRLKSFKNNIVGRGNSLGSMADAFASAGLLSSKNKEEK